LQVCQDVALRSCFCPDVHLPIDPVAAYVSSGRACSFVVSLESALGRQLPCSFFFLPGTAVHPGQQRLIFSAIPFKMQPVIDRNTCGDLTFHGEKKRLEI
jgi:hypothetical protein